MSLDENKARARRFIQVWAPGNLSVFDELAAPDITVIYPVLGEPVRGAAAFKQLLAHFHAACPDVEISVQEQIAEGDKSLRAGACVAPIAANCWVFRRRAGH